MDLGSWMVILAIAIITTAFIARPLVEKKGLAVTKFVRNSSTLLAERDRILAILQELELDYAMDKVGRDDYESQRADLVRQGASILKDLDELGVGTDDLPMNGNERQNLDAEIESAIARRRKSLPTGSAKFCSNCGSDLHSGDQFCVHCGAAVALAESEG
jgi:hypothetical protein